MTTPAVTKPVRMMNEAEARIACTQIKNYFEQAASRFADFVDREGWRALGYTSIGACIDAEFPFSKSKFYREVERAKVTKNLELQSNNLRIPEASVNALRELPPEAQKSAWRESVERGKSSTPKPEVVREVVDEYLRRIAPEKFPVETTGTVTGVRAAEPPPEESSHDAPTDAPGDAPEPGQPRVVKVEEWVREPGDDEDEPQAYVPVTDEEWLGGLSVREKLAPELVEAFDADAVGWRHAQKHLKLFGIQTAGIFKKVREAFHGMDKTPYLSRLAYLLRWKGPQEWRACADCRDEETGLSTGIRELLGNKEKCGTCKGTGYLVR